MRCMRPEQETNLMQTVSFCMVRTSAQAAIPSSSKLSYAGPKGLVKPFTRSINGAVLTTGLPLFATQSEGVTLLFTACCFGDHLAHT